MPSVQQSLLFFVKMYLAFGVVFQMPVVLMFVGKVGLVSSKSLITNWRQAVVVIGIVAAAATPSGDAMTMMMMCAPMILLYILSIGLVRMVERQ
jgi:sec-independent protein translocase protein TatC